MLNVDQDNLGTKPVGEFDNLNPYSAPQLDSSVLSMECPSQIPAGSFTRLIATLLDVVALLATSIVFGVGLGLFLQITPYNFDALLTSPFRFLAVFVFWTLGVFLQLVSFKNTGQTIGKRIMKICVVHADTGARCGLARYFFMRMVAVTVVYLMLLRMGDAGLIIVVGGFFLIFRQDRRCLHDWIASTRVVKV